MRKEIIYAILAGILFGLVVAFGVWRANSNIKSISKINNNGVVETDNTSTSPYPTISTPSQIGITLAKPESYSVTNKNSVSVNGLTSPESHMAISGETNDYIIKSDIDGAFNQEVELVPGVNEIIATAFNPNGEYVTGKVVIIYSSEFIIPSTETKMSPNPETSGSSTDSSIRQKVQEKVELALLFPKAYLGIITDISSGTIQINKLNLDKKDNSGKEIKQISIPTSVTFTKMQKGESKNIKISDVAIGDYIVAMGFINNNQVLEAQRILVTDPLEPTGRIARLGTVTSITKTKFKMKIPSQETETEVVEESGTIFTKYVDGKITKSSASDVKAEAVLIVAGTPDIKNFFARKIHILSLPETVKPTPKSTPIQ